MEFRQKRKVEYRNEMDEKEEKREKEDQLKKKEWGKVAGLAGAEDVRIRKS